MIQTPNFAIFKLENEPFDLLIISTSYLKPTECWDEIEKEFAKLGIDKAKILFDLSLINGVHDNRYVQYDYARGTNNTKACSIVRTITESVFDVSYQFFADNFHLINQPFVPFVMAVLYNPKKTQNTHDAKKVDR